ncbi:molybdopterin-binding oxidoreductase [Aeromonas bivalvium]|uniref:molybdopterin-binding oxidoreductase n=1 Tax=Aeromonas bivalvium TaxID=440079 RepID=UPI00370AE2C8
MTNGIMTWAACGLLLMASQAQAREQADEVLLTVSGAGCCGGAGVAHYTAAALAALPQSELVTATPWTQGKHSYRGVLFKTLIDSLGLRSGQFKVSAINDYWTLLPGADLDAYPVLLATEQDGKALTLRNKGPVWVVYPLSDHPELDREQYHSQMVWQVNRIEAQ